MEDKRKQRILALIGTLVVHTLLLLLLLFVGLKRYIPQEEEGVEVIFGDQLEASGEVQFTEELAVESEPEVEEVVTPPPPTPPVVAQEADVISQRDEASIALAEKKKREQQQQKEEQDRKQKEEQKVEQERKQKIEQERKRQQEVDRLKREAEERRLADEKAKADALKKKMSGAFATTTGTGQGNSEAGSGIQGSPEGNSKTGATQGTGGNGDSWSLNGRRIVGTLPRPEDRSNDEGRLVINITVDPSGRVINAAINAGQSRGTVVNNAAVRDRAVKAALSARFDNVEANANAAGTITYHFKTY